MRVGSGWPGTWYAPAAGDRTGGRRCAVIVAMVAAVLLAASGCSGDRSRERPRPGLARVTPSSTIALTEVGDALTVTATVGEVITDTAFVVRDVDLPDGRLLVLTAEGTPPAPPQLVTVQGTVIRFAYRELAGLYGLGEQMPYRRFEGRKVLAARQVTVWR